MRNHHIAATTGVSMYRQLLRLMLNLNNPHTVHGGEKIHSEVMNMELFVDYAGSLDFTIKNRGGRPYKYTEALWDLGPSDNLDVLKVVNPHMVKFVANQPLGTRDYATWAYGPTIYKELLEVAQHLEQYPTSRQACISMPRTIRTCGTPPCLASIQFFVREGRLHCTVYMRSNDVWLGVPLDVFQFGLMQNLVAGYLDLPIGSYTHYVGSMHLYERDYILASALENDGTVYTTNVFRNFTTLELTDVADGRLALALRRAVEGIHVPLGNHLDYYTGEIANRG